MRKFRRNNKLKNKLILAKHVGRLKTHVKNAKNKFIQNSFKTCNSKEKWKTINYLTNKGSKDKLNNKNVLTCDNFLSYFGKHFSQPCSSGCFPNITISNNPTCSLHYVDETDIRSYIMLLPNKSSKGFQDLPMFLWRKICDSIVVPVTLLVNKMISTSTFPNIFKISDLTPIYKKGDVNVVENYRPISCLHSLSKIFERVIFKCMSNFVNKYLILPHCQFGFRPNFSTKDAVVQLLLNIEKCREKSSNVCLVSIDFSKAFDTVNHKILLNILYSLGFRGKIYDLFDSYLRNRFFRVKFAGSCSKYLPVERGVPQGSVLGPLLYSIYVHDFNKVVSDSIVQYADDTTFFIPFNTYDNLHNSLNTLGDKLHRYCLVRNLSLNPDKTVIVIFGVSNISSIYFLNHTHNVANECKILGVLVDNKLKFHSQCIAIAKNIRRSFPLFYYLRDFVNDNIKRLLFQSFVCSHIIYSCPFLHMSYANSLNIIKRAYNKAFRILFKRRYVESFSSVVKLHKLCTLSKLIHIHSAVYAHKIFYHIVPSTICDCFNRSRRGNFILSTQNPHISIHNSLSILWNQLPNHIKSCSLPHVRSLLDAL